MVEPRKRMGPTGIAWLVLIATPPTLILVGMVVMFASHISQGTISPKWRKPAVAAPAASVAATAATNPPVRIP